MLHSTIQSGVYWLVLAICVSFAVRDIFPSPEFKRLVGMRAPALFVSHGGGPLPLLGVPDHQELAKFLSTKAGLLLKLRDTHEKPRALVVVTAHWETQVPAVSLRKDSKLFFDYYNFPPETYKYTYDAQGDPELAAHVAKTIQNSGSFLKVDQDAERGWDHGVFVPLKLIAPQGLDIPLIMVSVLKSQNAKELIKLGQALSSLRDEGYAILGSGTTFHNFDGIFAQGATKKKYYEASSQFEAQLYKTLDKSSSSDDAATRLEQLGQWQSWPHASTVQPPRAQDHFSPLVVLAGTMTTSGQREALLELSELPASCWTFD